MDPNPRLYRMGMLADTLVSAGHEVVWWTSTYDHQSGRLRYDRDAVVHVRERYKLRLLHTASGYARAVSGVRVINNIVQAWRFRTEASSELRPDLIFCAMPTPELAWVSCGLGEKLGVPVVLDARDMWPDIFWDLLAPIKRVVSLPYILVMRAMLRTSSRRALGCTSITEPFLDWIVGYAGRPRGSQDAVFPLAFRDAIVLDNDLAAASASLPVDVPGVFNVVFLGRLNRTVMDAFEPILAAIRLLRNVNFPVRFLFAGQGDCASELRRRSSEFPEIIFLGHLDTAGMEALKKRSHVALLCVARRRDYQISLPNKVFEYLAAGLPIASHLTGLVGELLVKEGCGFTYDDGRGLAEGLHRLAKDNEGRKIAGIKARDLFERRFSARAVYSGLAMHLEVLVSRKR